MVALRGDSPCTLCGCLAALSEGENQDNKNQEPRQKKHEIKGSNHELKKMENAVQDVILFFVLPLGSYHLDSLITLNTRKHTLCSVTYKRYRLFFTIDSANQADYPDDKEDEI
jgi:hypothetical protein